MSNKKYRSIACALALAASFTATAQTGFAAPEDEAAEETAAVEERVQEEVAAEQPIEQKRMPSPEEVDAMVAGKSPEMIEALNAEMQAKAARKAEQGESPAESDTEKSAEQIPEIKIAEPAPLPPIESIEIPVEMQTIKPEGYDPVAQAKAREIAELAKTNPEAAAKLQAELAGQQENVENEPAEENEMAENENVEEKTETKPEEVKTPAAAVTVPTAVAAPAVEQQQANTAEEKTPQTPEEIKAAKKKAKEAEKAAKKAEREQIKAEMKAKKAAEKAAKKAEKEAKKQGKSVPVADKAAPKKEAPAPVVDEAKQAWEIARPSEQMIAETMEKLRGRTIVDVAVVGAGPETIGAAKAAVITRSGDYFSQPVIDKDRESLYDTGLFYDLYPTFQIVPEGIVVTYNVMENPVLTDVSIKGNTVISSVELYKCITVEKGKVLNAKLLHENLRSIEELYNKDGYILVKLSGIEVGRDGKLNLEINEGTLEGYTVKGNTKTKSKVIIREMRQKPGEPFNAKKARRGMQRVYNLGFFEDVNMKLNPGVEPNAVVLEVDVVEKRTGTFTVGAGYSTRDGFLGMVGVGDRNYRGTGESFNITYEFGGDDFDSHGLTFTYHRPWMDRKETGLGFKIYNRTYSYNDYHNNNSLIEEYMRKQQGFEIVLSRPESEYTTDFLQFRNRKDWYKNHRSGEGYDRSGEGRDPGDNMTNIEGNYNVTYPEWRDANFGLTRSITFNHVTDTRDNIYNPTEGERLDLMFEYAGMGSKFKYEKYSIEQIQFNKVGHAQVFAWRWAYGRGHGHIPEIGQYRLGGQDTIRGYRDDSIRGNNMYLASLEYRFPVIRKVQGAIFTDCGAAWFGGWSPKGTKASIGIGVSVETPIGPIRVDVGHGSRGNRVHFSVGGAF